MLIRKAVFLMLALLLCGVLAGCETPVPKLTAEDIATIRLIDVTTTDFAEIPRRRGHDPLHVREN